jgi:hypothetical protein
MANPNKQTQSENAGDQERVNKLEAGYDTTKLTRAIEVFEKRHRVTDRINEDRAAGGQYWHFEPDYYHKIGLITPEFVNELLTTDERILTVGSGPAYLEQFLVEIGVPKERILLSDIEDKHLPKDFPHVIFDATQEWPDELDTEFQYVIFPDSFAVMLNIDYMTADDVLSKNEWLGELMIYTYGIKDDQILEDEEWFDRVMQTMERRGKPPENNEYDKVDPNITKAKKAIDQALLHTKPGGSVIITGPMPSGTHLFILKMLFPQMRKDSSGKHIRIDKE